MAGDVAVARVEDNEYLLRSVPNSPDFLTTPDLVTGQRRIELAALKFDDDGISVYRASLLQAVDTPLERVAKGDGAYVFAFPAELVRRVTGFDVIHSPDDEDPEIGFAHALIRYHTMPIRKKDKDARAASRRMRAAILAEARPIIGGVSPV